MTLRGNRKFIVCSGAIIVSFLALLCRLLSGGDYTQIVLAALAAFGLGNMVEHGAGAYRAKAGAGNEG